MSLQQSCHDPRTTLSILRCCHDLRTKLAICLLGYRTVSFLFSVCVRSFVARKLFAILAQAPFYSPCLAVLHVQTQARVLLS